MRSSKNTLKWLRWKYNGYARMNDLLLLSKCPLYSHYFLDLMGLSMDLQAHWQNWLLLLCVSHPYMTHGAGARATYVACPCRTCGTPWNTSYEDHNFPLDSNVRKWSSSWPEEKSWARHVEGSSWAGHTEGLSWAGHAKGTSWDEYAEGTSWVGHTEGSSWAEHVEGTSWAEHAEGTSWVGHAEGSSWAEHAEGTSWAGHTEGTSWAGHAEGWSSIDLNTQVELDMLNSQCIVNSMWYSPLYQSNFRLVIIARWVNFFVTTRVPMEEWWVIYLNQWTFTF